MKKVFSNSEVPHLWAHKSQSEGRNSTGSLFFDGDSIYSYGRHFLIAQHVTNARGESAVLFTTADYSVTTQGHKSTVRQSIPRSLQVFTIGLNGVFHHVTDDVITEYNQRKEEKLAKALRARTNRAWLLEEVQALHNETLAFCAFFDYETTLVTPLGFDAATLSASRLQREQQQAEKLEKAKQADLTRYAIHIEDWRCGRRDAYLPSSIDTMLRVIGDQVETSRGAWFPVSHALKGLRLVRAVVASGREWVTNGHKCHLGHYQIDRITVDGTVYAGCHVVKLAEIERIAGDIEEALQAVSA